ncbi:unnamed protein product [Nezara viridula]|uniref:IQ motif and ubiquitin-like domain-containing protein n=1 Tax=Nezara viridula TaxID=85310 RepID=A0A9P0EBN2_NEZVI|nr:unnamed protein product [Nezara viridula]
MSEIRSSNNMVDFVRRKSVCLVKNVDMVLIYFKMPNALLIREWLPLYTNIWEIQQELAANICANAGNIILKYKGSVLDPWIPLAGLEYEDALLFVFDVDILDDIDGKFGKPWSDKTTRVVKILNKENKQIELNVIVEIENVKKPWLGGFRHKITKVEYHHAVVQTDTFRERRHKMGEPPPKTIDNSSQTRKYHPKDTGCQTRHDHGTQMPLPGLYTATYRDRIIDPGTYKEYVEEVHSKLPVTCLNKFKKLCMEIINRSKEEKLRLKRLVMMSEKMKILKEHSQKAELNFTLSTIYPTDIYGIENLYSLVNNWYDKERKRQLEAFVLPTDPGFKAILLNLFKKKLNYLRQLDVLKTKQRDEWMKKHRMKLFDEAAKPKIRYYPKGSITVVETCDVLRSKILKELYSCYIRRDYKPEERVEMLLQLKSNVETTIPIDLALPLIELLNREIDMLSMGMKHLEGLRKRITEMLFYLFTSDEVFEKSLSESEEKITYSTMKCISCNELKPKKAFFKRSSTNNRHCKSCLWLHDRNVGVPPLGPYQFMLDEMRKYFKTSNNSILDIIQPYEIFRLVTKVWNGKSALSGNRDPYKLWLARWDVEQEWAPWNAILLTKDEAEIHEQVEKPKDFYEPHFVFEVRRKQLQAKMDFKKLREDYIQWKYDTDKDFNAKARQRKEEYFKSCDPFFRPAEYFLRKRQDTNNDATEIRLSTY